MTKEQEAIAALEEIITIKKRILKFSTHTSLEDLVDLSNVCLDFMKAHDEAAKERHGRFDAFEAKLELLSKDVKKLKEWHAAEQRVTVAIESKEETKERRDCIPVPEVKVGQTWMQINCGYEGTTWTIGNIEPIGEYYADARDANGTYVMRLRKSSGNGNWYPKYPKVWKLVVDTKLPADDQDGVPMDPVTPSPLTLNELAKQCWEQEKPYFPDNTAIEELAHIHSELSEALTLLREGYGPDNIIEFSGQKPFGIPYEMADVIIGALRFCGKFGININAALKKKMAYNATRADWAERAKKVKK